MSGDDSGQVPEARRAHWHRIKQIFEAVRKLPEEDRSQYLDREYSDDHAFRTEIESFLQADEHAGALLDPASIETDRAARNTERIRDREESLPERIGPYRVLQVIGEGGMGIVYLAEQTEPVHRRVALKIIKWGMDTRDVLARFEMERQALALMDHPNVARVLDVGATPEGRPSHLYVMRKLYRRHRSAFIVSGVIGALIVAGATSTILSLQGKLQAEREARLQLEMATRERESAKKIAKGMVAYASMIESIVEGDLEVDMARDLAEALPLVTERTDPSQIPVWSLAAFFGIYGLLESGDLDGAKRLLPLMTFVGGDVEAICYAAAVATGLGETQRAEELIARTFENGQDAMKDVDCLLPSAELRRHGERFDEAAEMLAAAELVSADDSENLQLILLEKARLELRRGRTDSADEIYRNAKRIDPATDDALISRAKYRAMLGNVEGTVSKLNRVKEERGWVLALMTYDPDFEPVRDDPQFQALMSDIRTALKE